MASFAGKMVTKGLDRAVNVAVDKAKEKGSEHAQQKMNGMLAKLHKQRPPAEQILSAKDLKLLKRFQKKARRLDKMAIFVGIVPAAGDGTNMAINYMYFIRPARKEIHLPPAVLAQMAGNNALSAWGGLIPIVGDVFVACWKANQRNAALIEKFLIDRELARRGETVQGETVPAYIAAHIHDTPTRGIEADEEEEKKWRKRVAAWVKKTFAEDSAAAAKAGKLKGKVVASAASARKNIPAPVAKGKEQRAPVPPPKTQSQGDMRKLPSLPPRQSTSDRRPSQSSQTGSIAYPRSQAGSVSGGSYSRPQTSMSQRSNASYPRPQTSVSEREKAAYPRPQTSMSERSNNGYARPATSMSERSNAYPPRSTDSMERMKTSYPPPPSAADRRDREREREREPEPEREVYARPQTSALVDQASTYSTSDSMQRINTSPNDRREAYPRPPSAADRREAYPRPQTSASVDRASTYSTSQRAPSVNKRAPIYMPSENGRYATNNDSSYASSNSSYSSNYSSYSSERTRVDTEHTYPPRADTKEHTYPPRADTKEHIYPPLLHKSSWTEKGREYASSIRSAHPTADKLYSRVANRI